MGIGEIIVIVAVSAISLGIIAKLIYDKVKGKSSCSCGGDCSHCSACNNRKN